MKKYDGTPETMERRNGMGYRNPQNAASMRPANA